ncbi:helix-turn-helix transcriptional regulator [Xanthobacter sp. AM11]|uniref:helix-turn-helix transcriptional regulator n=1 Tax=Xanthobacter sp. AM11 TaxID=3380643 RepID=UPI0039BFF376
MPKPGPDFLSRAYWNGTIKTSLSKFFILCVLHQRPMHGYDVARAVEATTNGCCSPTEGTIYPVLREFEEGGYPDGPGHCRAPGARPVSRGRVAVGRTDAALDDYIRARALPTQHPLGTCAKATNSDGGVVAAALRVAAGFRRQRSAGSRRWGRWGERKTRRGRTTTP